jgi:hypothetical protein
MGRRGREERREEVHARTRTRTSNLEPRPRAYLGGGMVRFRGVAGPPSTYLPGKRYSVYQKKDKKIEAKERGKDTEQEKGTKRIREVELRLLNFIALTDTRRARARTHTHTPTHKTEREDLSLGSVAIQPTTKAKSQVPFLPNRSTLTMFAYTICHECYDVVNYRANALIQSLDGARHSRGRERRCLSTYKSH